MQNFRDLSAGELAEKLRELTTSAPSSGLLRPLAFALDVYVGRGSEQLDEQAKAFDDGRKDYEYRVQRGYGGTMEWRRVVHAAGYLSEILNTVPTTRKK